MLSGKLGFLADQLADPEVAWSLGAFGVIAEFTKEGLAIEADGRIRSARVIEVLSRLVSARGAPRFLRTQR